MSDQKSRKTHQEMKEEQRALREHLLAEEIGEARRRGEAIALERNAYPLNIVGVKPTIAVFLAESPWGDIDDSAMDKGLGGRETALVQLAVQWAALGCDVYAFVPRKTVDIIEHEESGGKVRWIPNEQTIEVTLAVQPDLFVSWENVPILAELGERFTGVTAIEMQVAHLESYGIEVDEVADYICVLSEWAKDFILTQHNIEPSRVLVFANGVDLKRFDLDGKTLTAEGCFSSLTSPDEYNFIYSSSPDRGLHHLLKMWPQISQSVESQYGKKARLHVCYGIESFVANSRWSHREDGNRALTIEELINQPGVDYHGKIGQDVLASLMMDCDLMLYPADTLSPTETGCISIVEALAAGVPVVTTNCDCIGPDYKDVTIQVPLPLDYDGYTAAVLEALEPEDYVARMNVGLEFAPQRGWDFIAAQWIDHFFSNMTYDPIGILHKEKLDA